MTATVTISGAVIPDTKKLVWGTYSGAGTSETITTGLSDLIAWGVNNAANGRAQSSTQSAGVITVALASGSNESGTWWAIGS